MYQCDYQAYVQCEVKTCSQCGWNPEVAKARLEAFLSKYEERDDE